MDNFQLKILIVEDNLSFALELEMMLEELGYHVIGRIDNSKDALEFIHIHRPDLIMMDIHIKGHLTGVDIGQQIKDLNTSIIYVTSSKDETLYQSALQSNILGFLIKPVEKITLRSTIELAINRVYNISNEGNNSTKSAPSITSNNNQDYFINDNIFFFKKKGTYFKVSFNDITFVKSLDNYCEIHTVSEKVFTLRITMNKIQKLLSLNSFIRVHRQYIIHLNHIDALNLNKNIIKVQNTEIPLSRNRKKDLESLLKGANKK